MAVEEPTHGTSICAYILYDGNTSYALEVETRRDTRYYSFPSDGFTNYTYDSVTNRYLYTGAVSVIGDIDNPNYQYLTSSNDDDFLSRVQSSSPSGDSGSNTDISMNNSVKKTIIKKKINNVLYNIFPKSSADNIVFTVTNGDDTTVQAKLEYISTQIANAMTSSQVNSAINTACTNLYNQIMGLANENTTINEAYDTLKEVAEYLASHDSVANGFSSDISSLKTTVGDNSSGLVKDVNDLKTTVGDSSNGLIKDNNDNINNTSNLSSIINSKSTVKSSVNGYIKINGTNTRVYNPTNIPVDSITESSTRKFVTESEKNKINNAVQFPVVTTAPTNDYASVNDDLYIMVIDDSYTGAQALLPVFLSDIDITEYYTIYTCTYSGEYNGYCNDMTKLILLNNNYYEITYNDSDMIVEDSVYKILGSNILTISEYPNYTISNDIYPYSPYGGGTN